MSHSASWPPWVLCFAATLGVAGEVELPGEGARPRHGEPAAPESFASPELLTGAEQLAVWLGEGKTPPGASLVVLDGRAREEYAGGHLPGARNVESDLLQDPERKPYFLPAPEVIAELAAAAGINPDTRVVVYDAHGGRLAARVWFILWACGHEHASILDGGLRKWRDEKRPLTTDGPPRPSQPGTWRPAQRLRGVCAFSDLGAYRVAPLPGKLPPTVLIDARPNAEYTGVEVRSRHGGHIPGAVNIPWEAMLKPVAAQRPQGEAKAYYVWREPAEIHAILRAAGIQPGQALAIYDHSGGRAAQVLFTLRLLGYGQVVNYVGGWREYGSRDDVAIER